MMFVAPSQGIRVANLAMALNPLDPGWYYGVLGHAYRYAGRLDDGMSILLEYDRRNPTFGLVDLCRQGRYRESARVRQGSLESAPGFTLENGVLTQNCANPQHPIDDRQSLVNAGLSKR